MKRPNFALAFVALLTAWIVGFVGVIRFGWTLGGLLTAVAVIATGLYVIPDLVATVRYRRRRARVERDVEANLVSMLGIRRRPGESAEAFSERVGAIARSNKGAVNALADNGPARVRRA